MLKEIKSIESIKEWEHNTSDLDARGMKTFVISREPYQISSKQNVKMVSYSLFYKINSHLFQ